MPSSRKPATPMRRAQARARPSSSRINAKQLRALFDHALDAFLIADDQGNYVDANPAACALLGYSHAELIGLTIFDTTPNSGILITRAIWADRVASAQLHNAYPLLTKDERVLEVGYRLVTNFAPHRHLIVLRDQSEHVRAERLHAALYRMSEAAYAAKDLDELYYIAHQTVDMLMPAHNFYIALYDASADLFSFPYHRDEFDPHWEPHKPSRGLTSYVLNTGEPLLATPEVYDELLRAEKIVAAGKRAVDWLGAPLQTQAGTIGVIAVQTYNLRVRLTPEHRDILMYVSRQIATAIERKRSQEALRRAEAQFRAIVQNMPIMVAATNEAHEYLFWNAECERVTGYTGAEMIGRPNVLELLYPNPDYLCQIKTYWRQHYGEFRNWELELTCKNGTRRMIAWSNLSARVPIQGWASWGIGVDVTERALAEAQLRTMLQEKEILLREIHHRVKNNLNVVSGLLDLQSNLVSDADAQHAFAESQKRIRAMALLHETLYRGSDLARINIADYLNDLVNYLQTVYQHDRNVAVQVVVEQVTLNLDTAIVCGLIINELVTNAFKYAFPAHATPPAEGWHIQIALHRDADCYILRVCDNGVGIPASFDWQKSPTLGLQLVSLLAQQLSQMIQLDTTRGTCWHLTFPLAENPAPSSDKGRL